MFTSEHSPATAMQDAVAMTTTSDSIVLAPLPENVVVARRFIASWVAHLTSDRTTIGDLELAVSELVTNAIEHGDNGEPVEIAVGLDGDLLTVSVTSHGNVTGLAPTSEWEVAGAEAIAGRGLGIVRAVVDRIDVTRRRDVVTVTVGRTLASS